MTALTVRLSSILHLTDEQFFRLCQDNRDLRFEKTATGEVVIMPPTGGETGNRNGRLTQQLLNWADSDQSGLAFDSSTGFCLLNGAIRLPNAVWVSRQRWEMLTPAQRTQLVPLCPDVVVEWMSPSDNRPTLQRKMEEYRENGTRLGWLINRQAQQVEIYRLGQPVQVLDAPLLLDGEDVLPGFVLELAPIW